MNHPHDSNGRISRRDWLRSLALGTGAALSGCATRRQSATKLSSDVISRENQRAGTRSWLLENTRIEPATKYRCPWIEGYCSRTSVRAGQRIQFHVSTNPPSPFTLDLYRMGYYGECDGMVDVAGSWIFLLRIDRTKIRIVDDHAVFYSNVRGRHSSTFPLIA